MYFIIYRGETFRKLLLRIGEIHSLLPDKARIMALTATCTEKLRKTVSSLIGLRDELVISKSPCKNNIMYTVIVSAPIEEVFMPDYMKRDYHILVHLYIVDHIRIVQVFICF